MDNPWRLKSGEVVVDRFHSHLEPQAALLLVEALSRIESSRRQFLTEVVDFDRVIGETICVATGSGDEIIYAQRPKRFGLTRFVKNRIPEPCNTLVIVLKAGSNGEYVLITAFVGRRAKPEPWDEKFFGQQADPSAAREASRQFWSSHALVWGSEEMIPGTETSRCPWSSLEDGI